METRIPFTRALASLPDPQPYRPRSFWGYSPVPLPLPRSGACRLSCDDRLSGVGACHCQLHCRELHALSSRSGDRDWCLSITLWADYSVLHQWLGGACGGRLGLWDDGFFRRLFIQFRGFTDVEGSTYKEMANREGELVGGRRSDYREVVLSEQGILNLPVPCVSIQD